ncbi:arginine--tRNA ligase [Clostridiaceae bacterium]|nr:arginine--tRNA ligase [Clostridiaceae bacterium]RKI16834.1 arginine--tRNA ligase [bacterium 1XD21-70]
MKRILGLISARMEEAFLSCGYEARYAKVVVSNRPDLCEYQCNGAMAAAKAYRKKPIDIANEVVEALSGKAETENIFSEINSVMPGFINLRLAGGFLADYLNGMRKEEKLGLEEPGHGETVIVDYGGANVAKPLHVGHLRSAVIGESIRRMGAYLGYHMIGDVHLGDWGLQMGLIIEELRERKPELIYFQEGYEGEYPKEAPFTIGELEDIYPSASAKSKADEEFKERAQQATLKLQGGYVPYVAIWKHIMAVSLADLKKNYGNLDVHFDLWKGESDAGPYIPWLLKDLKEKGLARESQGALVVDIAEEGDSKELPPCIVQKSDGAALYATTDLGTMLEREKLYAPKRYIYIADKRQELHYTQIFRVAKKAGYVQDQTPMDYIGFGTMNGKDGKPFKTRDGGVMRLEQLIADIEEAVYCRIQENREVVEAVEEENPAPADLAGSGIEMTREEARKTAKMIGLAALKYGDLSNQAAKDYVFDMERFTSFTGNTGPYILYTIVRIRSILKNYHEAGGNAGSAGILPDTGAAERELMLELTRYNEVMEEAFAELAPHKICQYVYGLANAFNGFYRDNKILAQKDTRRQASWIQLIALVRDVLSAGIKVLGFEAPERM